MSIYFAPALVSLLLKLIILIYVLRGGKVSTVFLSLIGVFAIHNGIELFGYIQYLQQDSETVNIAFRLYYVATLYILLYILLHALSITKLENQKATASLIFITSAFSFLVLFTDSIIAGQYLIGYTMTAAKGSYYSLFATYILITLFSSTFILVNTSLKSQNSLEKNRCLCSLFALTPIILIFLITITFKLLELNINATGLIPIATTLFILIVLKTESYHKLSNVRQFMPLSLERETSSNFMSILDYYMAHQNQENVFKTVQNDVEREIIFYSLKKCNYNVTKTTEMMGLKNRSTLYSMMNRLNIDIKGAKEYL